MQFAAYAISAKNNGYEFSLHRVRNIMLSIQMLRIGVKCQKPPFKADGMLITMLRVWISALNIQ